MSRTPPTSPTILGTLPNVLKTDTLESQCVIQQQHRHYVLVVLLSEGYANLCHFDQSGAIESLPHPIHNPHSLADAIRFVRIILRVSMNSPSDCGVDPAWFCRDITKFVKINEKEYKFVKTARFQRSTLGRGSACFVVEGEDMGSVKGKGAAGMGEGRPGRFLVKKSWRHGGRVPEYELLNTVKEHNIQGVAAIIDWDQGHEREVNTCSFRKGLPDGCGEFPGRIHTCFVEVYYGETIQKFLDPVILLKAILSVIRGEFSCFLYFIYSCLVDHHDLYSKAGILHRDISADNTILAHPTIHPGLCGVLIDLDMAIYHRTRQSSLQNSDYRTVRCYNLCLFCSYLSDCFKGNILFQSIALLARSTGRSGLLNLDQDYLGDLESVIYVLIYLVTEWEKPLAKKKEDLATSSVTFT